MNRANLVARENVGGYCSAAVVEAAFARLRGEEAIDTKSLLESRLMDHVLRIARPTVNACDDDGHRLQIDYRARPERRDDLAGANIAYCLS
jgi:hypothetical protein